MLLRRLLPFYPFLRVLSAVKGPRVRSFGRCAPQDDKKEQGVRIQDTGDRKGENLNFNCVNGQRSTGKPENQGDRILAAGDWAKPDSRRWADVPLHPSGSE